MKTHRTGYRPSGDFVATVAVLLVVLLALL